jgi:hypothetical protein
MRRNGMCAKSGTASRFGSLPQSARTEIGEWGLEHFK